MKLALTLGVLLGFLAIGSAVASAEYAPAVHRADAEEFAGRLLREKYPTWTYRQAGYLDCRRGKINRTHWRCRVGWYKGNFCRIGRVQVEGEYFFRGTPFYGTHLRVRRC